MTWRHGAVEIVPANAIHALQVPSSLAPAGVACADAMPDNGPPGHDDTTCEIRKRGYARCAIA